MMSKVFFTSDTHYGSLRAIQLSKRPFSTIEQCDNYMVEKFNNMVTSSNDIVYHLGDFGDYRTVKYLNGKVILIWGNYELNEFYDKYKIKEMVDSSFADEFEKFVTLYNTKYSTPTNQYLKTFPENYWRFIFNVYSTDIIPDDRKDEFKALENNVTESVVLFCKEIKEYGFADVIPFNGLDMNLINSENRSERLFVHVCHEPIDCIVNPSIKEGVQYNLFGHIHGRQKIKSFGLDVGVDAHYFKPISKEDVFFYSNAMKFYDINVF